MHMCVCGRKITDKVPPLERVKVSDCTDRVAVFDNGFH